MTLLGIRYVRCIGILQTVLALMTLQRRFRVICLSSHAFCNLFWFCLVLLLPVIDHIQVIDWSLHILKSFTEKRASHVGIRGTRKLTKLQFTVTKSKNRLSVSSYNLTSTR